MRVRIGIALLVVAAVVALSVVLNVTGGVTGARAAVPAAGMGAPGAGCPMGMGCDLGKLAKELNLTDAQIAELKQRMSDFIAATKGDREALQTKCKEMIGLWTASTPDAAAIKALAAEMDTLRAGIRDAGIDHMVSALSVLTNEQREKLRTIVKDRASKCVGSGMCCGMGMGCGPMMGAGPGARASGCGMGVGPMGNGCPLRK